MRKHSFLHSIILVLTMAIFANCINNSREGSERVSTRVRLSQNSWRVWTLDDVAVINLMGIVSQTDSFDVHEVIGANYANSDTLKIKFLTGYDIVSAEKVTRYYPTIWAGSNDNVMQFIYLFNLCYSDTLSLNIHNGMIEYPLKANGCDSAYRQYFGSITQHQLLASIGSLPAEYARKNTSLAYKSNSWKYESNVWKRIAERYTSGELTDVDNEPFDVDPYEKLLIVTIKIGDSLYTKTFCDEAVIGN